MSYTTVEAGVQAIIQGLSAFSNADVSLGDYRVLDSGGAPYVVLKPGRFEHAPETFQDFWTEWTVNIELFVKFWGNGTEYTNIKTNMQAIVDAFDANTTLSVTGVVFAYISGGEEPKQVYDKDGNGPFFLLQTLTLQAREK